MTAHAINKTDKLKLNVETRTLVSTSETKDETKVYFEKTDFPERLRKIIADESVSSFASKINLSSAGVHKYLKGISEPTRPVLIAMSEIAGVNLEWLATGNGPMMKSEALSPVPSKNLSQENSLANSKPYTITNLEGRQVEYRPNPDLCHIPVLSLEAACGNGIFIEGESVSAVFSATRLWFKRELGHSPENLCLIQVRGDSMTDTIMPNEFVFIDRSSILEHCDSIWAFRNENSLFVKRLQFLPNNQIEVSSDNSHYKSYTIIPDHNFSLLGRVIATLPLRRL